MSITTITYLDLFLPDRIITFSEPSTTLLFNNNVKTIIDWLESLTRNKCYAVIIHIPLDFMVDNEDEYPQIHLSKPFVVTKNSNPFLLHGYFDEKTSEIGSLLDVVRLENEGEVPLVINYKEINLF